MLAKIRQTAIRMLARREHSRFELEQKLLQRGFDLKLITEVLEKLQTQDFQSDTRFLESYIRSRAAKGYGPLRITAELREKGLDKPQIAAYINNTETPWETKLQQTWTKKFAAQLPTTPTERAKQIRYLQYKGFSLEQIMQVFRFGDDFGS